MFNPDSNKGIRWGQSCSLYTASNRDRGLLHCHHSERNALSQLERRALTPACMQTLTHALAWLLQVLLCIAPVTISEASVSIDSSFVQHALARRHPPFAIRHDHVQRWWVLACVFGDVLASCRQLRGPLPFVVGLTSTLGRAVAWSLACCCRPYRSEVDPMPIVFVMESLLSFPGTNVEIRQCSRVILVTGQSPLIIVMTTLHAQHHQLHTVVWGCFDAHANTVSM
jgi:hypothetical protein